MKFPPYLIAAVLALQSVAHAGDYGRTRTVFAPVGGCASGTCGVGVTQTYAPQLQQQFAPQYAPALAAPACGVQAQAFTAPLYAPQVQQFAAPVYAPPVFAAPVYQRAVFAAPAYGVGYGVGGVNVAVGRGLGFNGGVFRSRGVAVNVGRGVGFAPVVGPVGGVNVAVRTGLFGRTRVRVGF